MALKKKIELAFYLNTVMDGDHYMTHFPPDMRTPPMRGGNIDVMPSDANYPRDQQWSGRMATYRTVEIDCPARAFQRKLQELHQEVLNQPFYDSWAITRALTSGRPEELVKAESSLNRLSGMTRPRNSLIVVP